MNLYCKVTLAAIAVVSTIAAQTDQPVPRADKNSQIAHQQLLAKAQAGRIDIYF